VGLSVSAYVASKVTVLGVLTAVQCMVFVLIVLGPQHVPPNDPTGWFGSGTAQEFVEQYGVSGELSDPHLLERAFPPIPQDGAALPSQKPELIIAVTLAGLVAMGIALCVSCLVTSSDRALVVLPVLIVVQMMLSIPILPDTQVWVQRAGYGSSAQWAMRATASTVSLNQLRLIDNVGFDLVGKIGKKDVKPSKRLLEITLAKNIDKEPRWKHESATWLRAVATLIAMFAASIGAAVWVLRRNDPLARRRRRTRAP
jgi:hypothetical protein